MTEGSEPRLTEPPSGEIVVRCLRGEAFKAVAAGSVATVGFAAVAVQGAMAGGPYAWTVVAIGLSAAMLFAGLTAWAWRWWRRAPAVLLIAPEGLIRSPESQRPQILPWREIRAFQLVKIGRHRILLIEPRSFETEWRRLSWWRRFRFGLLPFLGRVRVRPVMAIPDGLEIKLEELASIVAARAGAVHKE